MAVEAHLPNSYIFSNNNWLHMKLFAATIIILLCFGIESTSAQISTGTIRGTIQDIHTPVEKELRILLTETTTHALVQETSPASNGSFVFRNIPFSTYDITVISDSVLLGGKRVVVSSEIIFAAKARGANNGRMEDWNDELVSPSYSEISPFQYSNDFVTWRRAVFVFSLKLL
ncbi:MAG: hypothetical protein KGJ59_04755 [Bacteroidota bacterium]|nr:hypothetical protein [Bacteroidota bacterium]